MDTTAEARADSSARWFPLGLAAVAVGALALRVVYVLGWQHPTSVIGDAYYYHHAANLLAHGHGFPHPYRLLRDHVRTPGAQHPPLYIVTLALGSLVGLSSFLGHQLLSCLLGTVTVVLIALITRRLSGAAAGLVAAGVAAVYPNLWLNDGLVLSETLVQTMSALVVLTAYVFWQRRSDGSVAMLGVVVGLAALTRAELVLLAVVLVAPLCLLARPLALRHRVALLGVAAAGFLVVVAPWCVYNLTRYAKPVLVTTGLDPTLVVSNCDDTYFGRDRGYWSYRCLTKPADPAGRRVAAGCGLSAHRPGLRDGAQGSRSAGGGRAGRADVRPVPPAAPDPARHHREAAAARLTGRTRHVLRPGGVLRRRRGAAPSTGEAAVAAGVADRGRRRGGRAHVRADALPRVGRGVVRRARQRAAGLPAGCCADRGTELVAAAWATAVGGERPLRWPGWGRCARRRIRTSGR